jgi:hypothetical protein
MPVQSFSALGRPLSVVSLSKTNITQAELDAAVNFINLTARVSAVGSDQVSGEPFVTGVSDVVHVIVEGPAPAAGSNFGGVTGLTSAVVSYFAAR